MKQIDKAITIGLDDLQKQINSVDKKFEYLYKNPEFIVDVDLIKAKFGLSGRIGKKTKNELESEAAVVFTNSELKKYKIKKQSKKREFRRSILVLIKKFALPSRFEWAMFEYVLSGRYTHSSDVYSKCHVKVFNDNDLKRVFIEVFADTKKSDIIKVWSVIEGMIAHHGLTGEHLYRYENYYKHKILAENKVLDDSELNELNYDEKNIYRGRYKKYRDK